MPEENKEQGESMEGILKSIKNIISGELDKGENPSSRELGAAAVEDEVLELTNRVKEPSAVVNEPEKVSIAATEETKAPKDVLDNIDEVLGQQPGNGDNTSSAIETKEMPMPKETVSNKPADGSLITDDNAKAASDAMRALLEKAPKPHIDSPNLRSGQTLEDLVVESLKPMMSDWLNKYLPTIVKDLVEKEIRKISPKE